MRRNIYSYLASQWFAAGLAMVSSVLVARMMQPAELGVFTVTMAVTAILATLQTAGANEYLLFSKNADRETRRRVFGMMLILTSLACAGLVLGRPVWIAIYHDPGVADVAVVAAIQMALGVTATPIYAMLTREEQFVRLSAVTVICSLTLSILQVVLVWLGFSYMGLAYAALASTVVYVTAMMILAPQHVTLQPSFRGLGPIMSYGSKLFGVNALSTLHTQAPPMVIGALTGISASALYGRANMVEQIYKQTIARGVDPIVRARLAAERRAGADGFATLTASSRMLLTLSVAFFGFVAVAAGLIVPLIFGPQWSAAAPVMQILCIGLAVIPVNSPTAALLLAADRPGPLLRLRAVALGVRLGLLVLLAPFGLQAAAWGMTAAAYLDHGLSLAAARRYAGLSILPYLQGLWQSFLTGIIPVIVTFLVGYVLEAEGLTGWPLLFGMGVVMAVAVIVSMAVARHPLFMEAYHLRDQLILKFSRQSGS